MAERNDISKRSGERVKYEAKLKKLTQEQLAQSAKMSISKLRKIYQGDHKRPLQDYDAEILARIFGVRKEYLLCIDDYRTEEDYNWHVKTDYLYKQALSSQADERFLHLACNLIDFKHVAYRYNEDDTQWSPSYGHMEGYVFKGPDNNEVFINNEIMGRWKDECLRYAAFSLNALLNEHANMKEGDADSEK